MGVITNIFSATTLAFTAGLFLSILFGKVAIWLSNRFGILDVPGTSAHKKHKYPTPLAGGMVIGLSLVSLVLLFRGYYSKELEGILLASGIILIGGLIDDLIGLDVRWKLLGQITASSVLVMTGVQVAFIDFFAPETNYVLNIVVTVVWLTGLTNAFNLVDSADGLSISLAAVAGILLIFASFVSHQDDLIFQAGSLLGILIGLLFYNLPPAQLFLGDSGAQTLGFFLAALSILYNPSVQPQASSWFVPITLVAVPIFDVSLVFFSRVMHKKPFYLSDLNHTYHRLRAHGFSHFKVVWLMVMAALFAGSLGLHALYEPPVIANLIFAGIICVGIVLAIALDRT